MRARRTSGPGACRGMAGFARHALVLGSPSGEAAVLYVLLVLYVLPRRLPISESANQPISGARQRPLARRRRAGGAGESGSLEAWMLGSLAFSLYNYFACRPLVGRSVLRSLFSVLQGAKAPFPCRGVGLRPTSLPINFPIRQDTFLGNHRDARDGHGSEAQRAER